MKNSLQLLENAIDLHMRMEHYLQSAWDSFFLIPKLSKIDPEAMIAFLMSTQKLRKQNLAFANEGKF